MTDKKEIMIDGVEVSGCKEYIWALSHVCNLVNGRTDKFECNYYPNCYFKQLARKEQECDYWKHQAELGSETTDRLSKQLEEKIQECEKLKEQLMETKTFDLFADKLIEKFNTDSAIASIFKNNTRYRKALEEIEKVCIEDTREFADGTAVRYDSLDEILDIINKAKGR